jgi:oxygen-independent coproporphyrinogen-3 oxidase
MRIVELKSTELNHPRNSRNLMNPVNSSNSNHPSNPHRFEQQHGSTSAPMNLKKVPGLYIHIPFCKSKCGYCDFYSVTALTSMPDFIDALIEEMGMYREMFESFDTVYFGGGTPSILPPSQIGRILNAVRINFNLLANTEITLEVNPGDLDLAYLASLRDLGVNRLNIGVQSLDEEVLKFLGRRHSVGQAVSAIKDARKAGFSNLGLDLIYGVPGQERALWLETLHQAVSLLPEHLSCYQLTVEPHTPLGKRCAQGEFSLPVENLQYEFFMMTSETLEDAGYVHYEVSNFAKGMALGSKHNQKYWDHTPYLGLGPAAHSFLNNQRWWNHRSVDRYLSAIRKGARPTEGTEVLSLEQLKLEALYLGLRTKKGICIQDFSERYSWDILSEKEKPFAELKQKGLVILENGFVHPTRNGLALSDSLALI